MLDVDVDDSYVYSKAEQICSANLPFFLVKPLEVTWNLPQQHYIFIDISIHFFIVSYSENDSFEMWAHKHSNQSSINQVLIDVMQKSGECAPRDEVCRNSVKNVGNGLNWPPSPAEVAEMCSVSQIHELRRK